MDSPVQAQVCRNCQTVMPGNAYFCYICGKPVRKVPPSTSTGKQINIYLISFFIPPMGFVYGWRYIRQPNDKSKIVGVIAVTLTLLSLLLSIWTTKALVNYINEQLSIINSLSL